MSTPTDKRYGEKTWTKTRSELAINSRLLPKDHPRLTELRREYRAQRLEAHIIDVLAGDPPLTSAQIGRLIKVLRTTGHAGGAVA
jgi:hypothetical protein